MNTKSALVIANSQYEHAGLRQLTAPTHDAQALAEVLGDPKIGGFDVQTIVNQKCSDVMHEIEKFFSSRTRDDLVVLYFSGHGLKDEDGKLYLATLNTDPQWLRSTAIPDHFVNEVMTGSGSKRQVLLLDCCYSGAFAKALLAKGEANMVLKDHFEGRGRVLLTASNAVQYSFEGGKFDCVGESSGSVFTQALVQGLRSGAADQDGDGLVSLGELYDYVHDRVLDATPQQRPMKWELDVEGDMIIARNPVPLVEAADLPEDVQDAIHSKFPSIREESIHDLERLLRGKNRGVALAARNALMALSQDDSRRVSELAAKCLVENPAPAGEPTADSTPATQPTSEEESRAPERAEAERVAKQKAEQERLARGKAEAERAAREKAEQERLAREKAEEEQRQRERDAQAQRTEQERQARERAERERKAIPPAAPGFPCPKCRVWLEADAAFCWKCGNRVIAPHPTPSPTREPAPAPPPVGVFQPPPVPVYVPPVAPPRPSGLGTGAKVAILLGVAVVLVLIGLVVSKNRSSGPQNVSPAGPLALSSSTVAEPSGRQPSSSQEDANSVPSSPQPAAPETNRTTSEETVLLNRIVVGMGGWDRVREVRSLRIRGSVQMATPAGTLQGVLESIAVFPDRLWQQLTLPTGATIETLATPSLAFTRALGQTQAMSTAERDAILKELRTDPNWVAQHAGEPGYTLRAGGSEQVGEYSTRILEVDADGAHERWYVEPRSGLVVRTVAERMGADGMAEEVTDNSDWRSYGGFVSPAQQRTYRRGVLVRSGQVLELSVNPTINPALFQGSDY
ncbi:MAG TPA: caspase family protein [Terriglobia bacterium]|nr:caspase family protein [Terriglobia bacterium]